MASLRVIAALALIAGVAALRTAPAKAGKPAQNGTKISAQEISALRKRLSKMATGLAGMLSQEHGEAFNKDIAPALKLFLKNLQDSLKATENSKDLEATAKRLHAAEAGISSLLKDLNGQQEAVMKENEAQQASLLLGVLMTKQKEPMEKQLEILKSKDFVKLEVAQTLLAKHDPKVALFKQAADYLDKHGGKQVKPDTKAAAAMGKIQSITTALQKRVDILEREDKEGKARHTKIIKALEAKTKKGPKEQQRIAQRLLKKEERKFKKWEATIGHDLANMKAAVEAVKKGDLKALEKTKAAMEQSMKAMQAKSGGFLHLLQLGHKVMRQDCPYCAAQCLDMCHEEGKSYGACLAACADAGKAF
jgi:hypothetical protein